MVRGIVRGIVGTVSVQVPGSHSPFFDGAVNVCAPSRLGTIYTIASLRHAVADALRAGDEGGANDGRARGPRIGLALDDDGIVAHRAVLLGAVEARTKSRRRSVEPGLIAAGSEQIAPRVSGGIAVVSTSKLHPQREDGNRDNGAGNLGDEPSKIPVHR